MFGRFAQRLGQTENFHRLFETVRQPILRPTIGRIAGPAARVTDEFAFDVVNLGGETLGHSPGHASSPTRITEYNRQQYQAY